MLRSEFDALPWEDDFESSNIARVAFEPALSVGADSPNMLGTLYVEFHGSGRVYSYEAVRREQVAEMLAADSVGGYFNAEIKGSFEYAKVTIEHDPI